jgi:tetratricopeptide (TPR) repeat protein
MLTEAAQSRLALVLLLGVFAASLLGLGWFAWQSPQSRVLSPEPAAEWICYPVPVSVASVGDGVTRHAVFVRRFELTGSSAWARLRLRTFGGCSVQLNGAPVALPEVEFATSLRTCDLREGLPIGANELRVEVSNEDGPPVLWLHLEGPEWSVASDDQWKVEIDGAAMSAARRACQVPVVRGGNPAAGGPQTLASLRICLPAVLVFLLLSTGGWLLLGVAVRRQVTLRYFGRPLAPLGVGLAMTVVLWVALFVHNTFVAPPFPTGFDVQGHLAYIQFVQQHKALPLATDGWEMYQPPLYYVLAAGLLGACGLAATDVGAAAFLRLLGLAIGLTQLVLVAGCLHRIFPGKPRRQVAGMTVATFLPAHLYLSHYVTNEALATTLATAAIFVCLGVLADERPSPARHALLGLCLGAALLTKLTAIVVTGVVLLVLAGRLVARRERRPLTWIGSVGVVLVVTTLVCGGHYARVWANFGTPMVSNFDRASGFRFWQDPGYADTAYLVRFGRSLTDPFFSALHSLPDGLYSTLWGDGLCGGASSWTGRPPWNYDLMAAGYLLALVPTLAILVGFVAALFELVRRPRAKWFLLLGVSGGLCVALLFQFLRYPYYGHVKAIYLLGGMAPLCAFAGSGADLLARLGRVAAVIVAVLLGTWAVTAYAAYWIPAGGAIAQNWEGRKWLGHNEPAQAERCFRKAVAADPHSVPARLSLVELLLRRGALTEARGLIEGVLADDPDNADALLRRAILKFAAKHVDAALAHLRRASEVAPDHPTVFPTLGGILMHQQQFEKAIAAYRQALRVQPSSPSNHANLGQLLVRTGRVAEGMAQYRHALALRPDHVSWNAELAWILATQEDARIRDPDSALRLAQKACRLTEDRDAASLQALAAAQAAGGHYADALTTARRAEKVARIQGRLDLTEQAEAQIRCYEKGTPFRPSARVQLVAYPPVLPRTAGAAGNH